MTRLMMWAPATVLALGAVFTVGVDTQRVLPLRAPLSSTVPDAWNGYVAHDVEVSAEEQQVAGMSDYLMRAYAASDASAEQYAFSVYVGYYESQRQGKTIHSPKNCLPGSGWEALQSTTHEIRTTSGLITVNRYLLKRGQQAALVLYWYQGRGRVEASEYKVKLDLLRDSMFRQRSDEALVRIVVPVATTEEDALELAARVAADLAPAVDRVLPE
jgi:EpsI family protein